MQKDNVFRAIIHAYLAQEILLISAKLVEAIDLLIN